MTNPWFSDLRSHSNNHACTLRLAHESSATCWSPKWWLECPLHSPSAPKNSPHSMSNLVPPCHIRWFRGFCHAQMTSLAFRFDQFANTRQGRPNWSPALAILPPLSSMPTHHTSFNLAHTSSWFQFQPTHTTKKERIPTHCNLTMHALRTYVRECQHEVNNFKGCKPNFGMLALTMDDKLKEL